MCATSCARSAPARGRTRGGGEPARLALVVQTGQELALARAGAAGAATPAGAARAGRAPASGATARRAGRRASPDAGSQGWRAGTGGASRVHRHPPALRLRGRGGRPDPSAELAVDPGGSVRGRARPPPGHRSAPRCTDSPSASCSPPWRSPSCSGSPRPPGEELPPGFTDGVPVGAEAGTDRRGGAASGTRSQVAAAPSGYFGAGAYGAVRCGGRRHEPRPARSPTTCSPRSCSRPCSRSRRRPPPPSTAPSPMTLSRYDEWNGMFSHDDGHTGEQLRALRLPQPVHRRTGGPSGSPGIGIWQYDSAGLGAPLTTAEAMDVGTVAGDVARVMSARTATRPPPWSGTPRRSPTRSAATPPGATGGYPCTLCQGFFDEMMGTTPAVREPRAGRRGSAPWAASRQRTCTLAGVAEHRSRAGTSNPAVGVIQGATAWATLSPGRRRQHHGRADAALAPRSTSSTGAPRRSGTGSAPTRGTPSTSGRAARSAGTPARSARRRAPASPGRAASTLCDVTAVRGACGPCRRAGVSATTFSVAGSYRPVALDANGDGRGDILWYAPGSGPDYLWLGTGPGTFSSTTLNVTKTHVLTVLRRRRRR